MNTKNKILFVIPSNSNGGAEQLQFSLINYWSNVGYEIDIVFLLKETQNKIDLKYANIYYLNAENLFLGLIKLFFFKFSKDYYVTFSSQTLLNASLGILKKIKKLRTQKLVCRESTTVFSRFGGFKLGVYKMAYSLGYRFQDLIICQTDEMKNELIENVPYLRKKNVQTISNPIDLEKIHQLAQENIDHFFVKNDYIVSAGRLIPIKNFELLINTFYHFLKLQPSFYLVILGEGELKDDLINLCKKLEIRNKVIFKGFVQNPIPYFKNAKICSVSSIKEGFPNVLLQMMSQNGRVVSSLCAGDIDKLPSILTYKINDKSELYEALLLSLKISLEEKNENINKNLIFLENRSYSNYISNIFTELKKT